MISKTCLFWAVLGAVFLPPPAQALVEGEPHALYQSHRLFGAAVAAGMLASLVPGWRAYRLSLADGLSPRT